MGTEKMSDLLGTLQQGCDTLQFAWESAAEGPVKTAALQACQSVPGCACGDSSQASDVTSNLLCSAAVQQWEQASGLAKEALTTACNVISDCSCGSERIMASILVVLAF